eukprot:14575588-Alexandrium_andersonii.AAC.1
MIRYGLADSSPQIHRDWLILHYQSIKAADLLDTWDAVQLLDMDAANRSNLFRSKARLKRHRNGLFDIAELEADDPDDLDRPPPLTDSERKSLNKILETNITPHTCTPVAVGAAHRSLAHKVSVDAIGDIRCRLTSRACSG